MTVLYGDGAELSPEALEEPADEIAGADGPEWILMGGAAALHDETFPTRHCEDGE